MPSYTGYIYSSTTLERSPFQTIYVSDYGYRSDGTAGDVGQNIDVTLPADAHVGDVVIMSLSHYFSHAANIVEPTGGGVHRTDNGGGYCMSSRGIPQSEVSVWTCTDIISGARYWRGR
jgi:hypothetical protein